MELGFQRTPEQDAVVYDRGGGLLVSAAAGSGKTRVLVERLLERVATEGRRIDEFLIITFTRAAAEELRGRIARELNQRLGENPGDLHLRRQNALLYQTQISTIHSLCTVILREWGHLRDIPADFVLCEEEEAQVLMLTALNEVLEGRYQQVEPGGDFARLLDTLSAGRDDSRLMEIVLDVYGRTQSHADPLQWMEEQRTLMALEQVSDVGETLWGRMLLEDTAKTAAYWQEQIRRALSLTKREESLSAYQESLEETLQGLQRLQDAALQGWDAAGQVTVPFPRLKAVRGCLDKETQMQIKRIREACKEATQSLQDRFLSTSDALLEDLRLVYPAMRGLFDLVSDFSEAYRALKKRKGMLDFSDLEHETVSLLTDETGAPTELAQELASRFTEIMVDEYQDTNQVQNTIFDALSKDGNNLFMVGDVKQSIYRFRLADPTIFLDKYRSFLSYQEAEMGEPRKITLSQNFRSRPQVLEAANYLFHNIMSQELGEMDYTEQEALHPGAQFPSGAGYETEFHLLNFQDAPELTEDKLSRNALEAKYVAAQICQMFRQGFMVTGEDGEMRPVQPEDMVILLRSPGTLRHHYEAALAAYGIPWASEGGGTFFAATEVSIAISLLQIIDNPHQDVPLLAVLRSPVYHFSPDRLAEIRKAGDGDFYMALQTAGARGIEGCQDFLEELAALRFRAGESSSHQLIWDLYRRTHLIEIFQEFPQGEERKKNLLILYELARRFEGAGHRGLFGFLNHLERTRENGIPVSLPSGAQESAGVKILSIHRAKGLEYPVVFLCGLGKRFNYQDTQRPVLFHSKLGLGPKGFDEDTMVEFTTLARDAVAMALKREMLAEEMRLLYVAMTRAKEKLIMTYALSYGESELQKLGDHVSRPAEPQALADCSCVGQWILLTAMTRPEGEALRQAAGIGMMPEGENHGPSWRMHYHRGSPPAPEQKTIVENQNAAPQLAQEAIRLFTWQYPHETMSTIPAKVTATQQKERSMAAEETPAVPLIPNETPTFFRPKFATDLYGLTPAERGTAMHTALQAIRYERTGTSQEVKAEVARLVSQGYLTEQQGKVVDIHKITRFFQSTLGRQLREVAYPHREYPFSVLMPAQTYYEQAEAGEEILLQGVIDVWFETLEGITIVDFKTDHITAEESLHRAERYRGQMDTYQQALEAVTGKKVAHRILWFLAPGCEVELPNVSCSVTQSDQGNK